MLLSKKYNTAMSIPIYNPKEKIVITVADKIVVQDIEPLMKFSLLFNENSLREIFKCSSNNETFWRLTYVLEHDGSSAIDDSCNRFVLSEDLFIGENDPNNMGAVMAPAAGDTIFRHLNDLSITPDYYDLILTGDLGIYGKEILKDYMKKNYNITLENYNDCGAMLYDVKKQHEITAGGSGPVCSCLVNYGYIYNMLKTKKLKKVLFVTTGALFSPTFLYQKEDILGIAHAVSMEVLR